MYIMKELTSESCIDGSYTSFLVYVRDDGTRVALSNYMCTSVSLDFRYQLINPAELMEQLQRDWRFKCGQRPVFWRTRIVDKMRLAVWAVWRGMTEIDV